MLSGKNLLIFSLVFASATTHAMTVLEAGPGQEIWKGTDRDRAEGIQAPEYNLATECHQAMFNDLYTMTRAIDFQADQLAEAYLKKDTPKMDKAYNAKKDEYGRNNGYRIQVRPQFNWQTDDTVTLSLAIETRGDVKFENEPAGQFVGSHIEQPIAQFKLSDLKNDPELCDVSRGDVIRLLKTIQGDLTQYTVHPVASSHPFFTAVLPFRK